MQHICLWNSWCRTCKYRFGRCWQHCRAPDRRMSGEVTALKGVWAKVEPEEESHQVLQTTAPSSGHLSKTTGRKVWEMRAATHSKSGFKLLLTDFGLEASLKIKHEVQIMQKTLLNVNSRTNIKDICCVVSVNHSSETMTSWMILLL